MSHIYIFNQLKIIIFNALMCIVFGISNVCGIKREQYGDTGGQGIF